MGCASPKTVASETRFLEQVTPPDNFVAVGCNEQCVRLVLPNNQGEGTLPLTPNYWFSKQFIKDALQSFHDMGYISTDTLLEASDEVDASDLPAAQTAWEKLYLTWVPGHKQELQEKEREARRQAEQEARAAAFHQIDTWVKSQGDEATLRQRIADTFSNLTPESATLTKEKDGTFTFTMSGYPDESPRTETEVLPSAEVAHAFVHLLNVLGILWGAGYDRIHKITLEHAPGAHGSGRTRVMTIEDLLGMAGKLNALPSGELEQALRNLGGDGGPPKDLRFV